MERNYGEEINALKSEISEIKAILKSMTAEKDDEVSKIKAMLENEVVKEQKPHEFIGHIERMLTHKDENINALMRSCENQTVNNKNTGCITYLGVFASGGRQSSWVSKDVNTDNLLNIADDGTAEKVLSCIGSREKLGIITSLLKRTMTVSELIDELKFNSTGQAYHHLRPLIAADIVCDNEKKGCYMIVPHRVQGIIMILAGISDIIDGRYSSGSFDDSSDSSDN